MIKSTIPAFYFPSTVLFWHCDYFLEKMVFAFQDPIVLRVLKSPKEIIQYVKRQHNELEILRQKCLSNHTRLACHLPVYQLIDKKLTPICAEIYHENRFAEISVIIIHDAVIKMHGLEALQQIQGSECKKIYITEQPHTPVIQDAVKNGIIDLVLDLNASDLSEEVARAVSQLQQEYFQYMSQMTFNMLDVTCPEYFNDVNAIKVFQQIYKEYSIVEHYIFDAYGSCLLLDANANLSIILFDDSNSEKIKNFKLTHDAITYRVSDNCQLLYFKTLADKQNHLIHSYNDFLEVVDIEERLLS